jgi:tRNA(Ile)-lysidine synthase
LIKDRSDLIITPFKAGKNSIHEEISFLIEKETSHIKYPIDLVFRVIHKDRNYQIDFSPETANLDLHKITFPLTLRKWRRGDNFHPFGRSGKKKLSDFFTDNKFSLADKERTWLLCSGDKILWIVGHRIDNRFRITPKTKEVLQVISQK